MYYLYSIDYQIEILEYNVKMKKTKNKIKYK